MARLAPHHAAWLKAHPYVDRDWLSAKLGEGFHVHHLDHNRMNNDSENLVLMFGPDHTRMHRLERAANAVPIGMPKRVMTVARDERGKFLPVQ